MTTATRTEPIRGISFTTGQPVKEQPWLTVSLPLLLLLSLVVSVGLGVYALTSLKSVLVRERGAELSRTAVGVADTLDRVLFERFGDIQAISNDAILRDGTQDEKINRLREYKQLYGYYSRIATADDIGRIIAATDSPPPAQARPATDGSSLDQRDCFESVRRTGHVYVGEPQRAPESGGALVVSFGAPIRGSHGEFRGAVISQVPLENFRTIIDKAGAFQLGEEPYDWLLMDRSGITISERDQVNPTKGNLLELNLPSAVQAAADRHKSGFVEELHPGRRVPVVTGYARTRGYRDFAGFDWTVLMQVDHDRAYAPINELVMRVGAIGSLVLAPLTGFGIWASWKIIREDRALSQASRALENSVADLTRSNADLQQFAYVASHDLQEPLRMVASYTQLLGKRYKGKLDSDADEFIGYAVDGANRMQRLIQDLLSYSRITTQDKAFEPIDCNGALESAIGNLRMTVEKEKAVVTHDPLPIVMGDSTQIVQLFQNLISNAIKFHGADPPRIHVSAERTDTEWLFAVRDNGIGIDSQYAARIFVIFQRLHTVADYPGTGIGLALCKKIVQRHCGRIWVDSQPGHGATFYFTFPLDPISTQAWRQT